MSDEISPAPLRLKPRLQPDRPAEAASAPVIAPATGLAAKPANETRPAAPSTIQKEVSADEPLSTREAADRITETAADTSRFKLKPKASPAGDSPKPELAAPPSPAPNPTEAGEAARFKLKPKTAGNVEPPTATPVPIATANAVPATPLSPAPKAAASPAPAALPPAASLPKSAPPPAAAAAKAPFIQAPRGSSNPESLRRRKTDKPSGFKGGALVVAGLVAVLLGVAGVFSYGIYQKLANAQHATAAVTSSPSTVPTKSSPAAATATTASSALRPGEPVVDNPTSDAGKLVAKARDTVAAHDNSALVQGVNEVLDDSGKSSSSTKPSRPVASAPMQASSTPAPAEEPVATPPPAEEPVPEPSRALRDFVVNMRVSGVFQGTPARALLNGKMAHEGEIIDFKLGILLFQVDPQKKLLVFKESTGATMSRRY